MSVQKKTTYQAGDGREFFDPDEAARYQEYLSAKREYDSARFALAKILAEGSRTADGHQFEFGLFTQYYWVSGNEDSHSLPCLVEISFWGRNWDVENVETDRRQVVLLECKDNFNRRMEHLARFPIGELYRDRARADQALRAAKRAWLERRLAELNRSTTNP